MGNVKFIISKVSKENEIAKLLINYLETKWSLDNKWLILTENKTSLSDGLWTAKTLSFLPHKDETSPIVLSEEYKNVRDYYGVINLLKDPVLKHNNVIEFVFFDEKLKAISRDKYKSYKLNNFNITKEDI
jgi:DNA polymerase IIIc chi subunit